MYPMWARWKMALERFTFDRLPTSSVVAIANALFSRLARWADMLTRMQRRHYRAASAATTLSENDDILFVDTTGGSIAVTLPPAASTPGKEFFVKKVAAANTLTLTAAGSNTIDGAATLAWTVNNQAYTVYSVNMATGTYNWLVL